MTNSRGHYLGDDRFGPLVAELDRRAAVVLLHPTSTEHHRVVNLGRPRPMLGSNYAWTRAEVAIRALADLDKLLRLDKPGGRSPQPRPDVAGHRLIARPLP